MVRRRRMPDGHVIKSDGDGPLFTLEVSQPDGQVTVTLKLNEADATPIYKELGRFLGR